MFATRAEAPSAGAAPSRRLDRLVERAPAIIVAGAFLWCLQRAYVYATLMLSVRFAPYDDEGYLLLTVREFLAGGALYDRVFTQYGPAYYAYRHLLSVVQGLPTHDLTRNVTVVHWLLAAALLALAALWLTRSGVAALAMFCAMFAALVPLVNEPGHPQELMVVLTALSVAVAACPIGRAVRAAALVAITAVAGLAKINIGMFIGLATLTTVLPIGGGTTRILTALVLGSIPAILMAPHLTTWAWPYATGAGAGIAAATAMAPDVGVRLWSRRQALVAVGAAVIPGTLICLYTLARGTTIAGLVSGALLRPMQLGGIYTNPFPASLPAVAVSLAAACLAVSLATRGSAVLLRLQPAAPWLKIAGGFYVAVFGVRDPQEIIAASAAVIVVTLLPARRGETPSFGRVFLALSAAWHACIAYPVAGSQVAWSVLLLNACAWVCVWDGLSSLRPAAERWPGLRRTAATAVASVAIAAYYASSTPLATAEAAYQQSVPLPFEGARSIRLPHEQAATYTWLVQNVVAYCDRFVTQPGYGSLYLWSGMRPPSGFNATAWMFLLSDGEQRATVESMTQAKRACAIHNPGGVAMWTTKPLAGRPLADYVATLKPVIAYAGFEFRLPAERLPEWKLHYLLTGRRSFAGSEVHPVPADALLAPSWRLWFRSDGRAGAIVGVQSDLTSRIPTQWTPMIYVGRDGRLRALLWNGTDAPMTTQQRVDDGQWHHVALVKDGERQRAYVDGALVGEAPASGRPAWGTTVQLGTGYTAVWPEGGDAWFPFTGELRDAAVSFDTWTADDVLRDWQQSRDAPR